jgi:hypothetical protein
MSKTLGHLRSELENMTFERWSLEYFNDYVSDFLGFKVEFIDIGDDDVFDGNFPDYRVVARFKLDNDVLAFVDVYHLIDRFDNMLITEIDVSTEGDYINDLEREIVSFYDDRD